MGCGGSKGAQELAKLGDQQRLAMKQQEQIAMQQQQQIKLQAEQLENARQQQNITQQQFEEQKKMLLDQQAQLLKQQEDAIAMAIASKEQAEMAANSAATAALKKAEEMKRRITPPPKPGKVNRLMNTDKTIPPHAIMKRRKKYDQAGNLITTQQVDKREECGGVGMDSVPTPAMQHVPVMVVTEKRPDKKRGSNESDEDEYEYQYEYQYQFADGQSVTVPGAVYKPLADADFPQMVQVAAPVKPPFPAQRGSKDSPGSGSKPGSKPESKPGSARGSKSSKPGSGKGSSAGDAAARASQQRPPSLPEQPRNSLPSDSHGAMERVDSKKDKKPSPLAPPPLPPRPPTLPPRPPAPTDPASKGEDDVSYEYEYEA